MRGSERKSDDIDCIYRWMDHLHFPRPWKSQTSVIRDGSLSAFGVRQPSVYDPYRG